MADIQRATVENIGLIQELAYAIWPVAYKELLSPQQIEYMLKLMYSREALVHQISNLHHQFLLALENAVPQGFASFSRKTSTSDSVWRLHKLYVHPDQQKIGTGKHLITFLINEIQPVAKTLELNVNRDNPAIHFYHKMGFKIIKAEDIDIGNGYYMNDYVMELTM